jgi:hypothetical protein
MNPIKIAKTILSPMMGRGAMGVLSFIFILQGALVGYGGEDIVY